MLTSTPGPFLLHMCHRHPMALAIIGNVSAGPQCSCPGLASVSWGPRSHSLSPTLSAEHPGCDIPEDIHTHIRKKPTWLQTHAPTTSTRMSSNPSAARPRERCCLPRLGCPFRLTTLVPSQGPPALAGVSRPSWARWPVTTGSSRHSGPSTVSLPCGSALRPPPPPPLCPPSPAAFSVVTEHIFFFLNREWNSGPRTFQAGACTAELYPQPSLGAKWGETSRGHQACTEATWRGFYWPRCRQTGLGGPSV